MRRLIKGAVLALVSGQTRGGCGSGGAVAGGAELRAGLGIPFATSIAGLAGSFTPVPVMRRHTRGAKARLEPALAINLFSARF
ncbi:MAG: hypothetical protein ABIV28_02105 [Longimicrobiales bacterium]